MSTMNIRYGAQVLPINSVTEVTSNAIGGFLCKTSGTLKVEAYRANGGLVTIIDEIAQMPGWTWMPFYLGVHGGRVTTGMGCSGTLAI